MINRKTYGFVQLVIKQAILNIKELFPFDDLDDSEFKAKFGYTKKEILDCVKGFQNEPNNTP